jgi:hypothetical protein
MVQNPVANVNSTFWSLMLVKVLIPYPLEIPGITYNPGDRPFDQ